MQNEKQLSGTGVGDATLKAKTLLASIVDSLTAPVKPLHPDDESSVAGTNGEPGLFFPDGIGLISVDVKIAPVNVQVTISGPSKNGAALHPGLSPSGGDETVHVGDDNAVGHPNAHVMWQSDIDRTVIFCSDEGSPFDDPASLMFDVLASTGLTAHVKSGASGTYHYCYVDKTSKGGEGRGGGNSKIIIQ